MRYTQSSERDSGRAAFKKAVLWCRTSQTAGHTKTAETMLAKPSNPAEPPSVESELSLQFWPASLGQSILLGEMGMSSELREILAYQNGDEQRRRLRSADTAVLDEFLLEVTAETGLLRMVIA